MITRIFSNRAVRWYLLGLSLVLCLLGVLFVHSTMRLEGENFPGRVARSQAIKAGIAFLGFLIICKINYRLFERKSYTLYGLVILFLIGLLALKFLRGDSSANRWFRLALFDVQPSELMKIGLILCLARYLRFRNDQGSLKGLLMPCLLTIVPMGLVLLQPDLGTSLVLPCILLAMIFVAGARWQYIVVVILLATASVPAIYKLGRHVPLIQPYQLSRLTGYFEQNDPAVRGREAYQLDQSEVAIGSGGLTGRGYGLGDQNNLGNLPARHTDFIFSVIGEEWGFIGACGVVLALVSLVMLCFLVAANTREPYGKLVATGIGALFAVQSYQNICMTMGLTPITGLPLPFVSYGGSSLVCSFAALALVIRVASQNTSVLSSKDLQPRKARLPVPIVDPRPTSALLVTQCQD